MPNRQKTTTGKLFLLRSLRSLPLWQARPLVLDTAKHMSSKSTPMENTSCCDCIDCTQCYYNSLFQKEVEELIKRFYSNPVWVIILRRALNMESKLSLLLDYAADIEKELDVNVIRQTQLCSAS
ncbi:uncharacterized protein LOC142550507 [Primulina tabacum]|uniref:uncharacterized protein LOC142550507 n=1 Tax=Primulina tabacum TaxID=48773 RepID=UPI003F597EB3